jgi:DNA-binding IclR family transcriptional regulator
MMRNPGVQTVDRALQLLLAFDGDRQELGVTELAACVGVHKSTASRLAATLAGRGFLERAPGSDGFRLGPELGRLGLLALGGRDLAELARPIMERLADDTGETVNLAILDGSEAVNVAQVEGRHFVGVGSWTGRRTALHCTANGKVLLAFGASELSEGPYEDFTTRTITSPDLLRRELATVRARGWASAVGELEDGLHAVAAPVIDADGVCRAALSASGPAYRMSGETLTDTGELCRVAALGIGGLLGGSARAA